MFLCFSAQANQICPKGYTDGDYTLLRDKYFITYNGSRYDCPKGDLYSKYPYVCGDIGYISLGASVAFIRSKEGVLYSFSGNDDNKNPNNFRRLDCPSNSYCLLRTMTNNLAKPDEKQINFNILISRYTIEETKCNKLSF